MIVPGGGISRDGSRWIAKRPDFFLPVRVLAKLFRRLMIEKLVDGDAAPCLERRHFPRRPSRQRVRLHNRRPRAIVWRHPLWKYFWMAGPVGRIYDGFF
jgi:hypothetical protein